MHSHPAQFPRTMHWAMVVCAILAGPRSAAAEAELPRRSPQLPSREETSLVALPDPRLLPSHVRAIRGDTPAAEQATSIERGPPSSCQFPDSLASPAYDPTALVDVWPRTTTSPAPIYPPEAVRLNQSGTVVVRVSVDATGKVSGISLHKSSGVVVLDAAALRAVVAWKFAPAQRNGRPVAAEVLAPIHFVLEPLPLPAPKKR